MTEFNMTERGSEPYEFNSVICTEGAEKIISFEEYCDLLTDVCGAAFCLADGFIFCEGDMTWFLPADAMDVAKLGTPLLKVLTWDIDGYRSGGPGDVWEWALPKEVRANMETQLAVLKEAQAMIEHALARDIGPDPDEE